MDTVREADVEKFIETSSQKIEQQQAVFISQAEAQVKAWREAAENPRTSRREAVFLFVGLCPLLAHSRHRLLHRTCPLSDVKQT